MNVQKVLLISVILQPCSIFEGNGFQSYIRHEVRREGIYNWLLSGNKLYLGIYG